MKYIVEAIKHTYEDMIDKHDKLAHLVSLLEIEDDQFESQLLVKDIDDFIKRIKDKKHTVHRKVLRGGYVILCTDEHYDKWYNEEWVVL